MPIPIWLIFLEIYLDNICIVKKDIDNFAITNDISEISKTESIMGFHSFTFEKEYHIMVATTSRRISSVITLRCFLSKFSWKCFSHMFKIYTKF
jgi:hypothetical protein